MKIEVKRLREGATLPTKAHDTDAGFDLYLDFPGVSIAPSGGTIRLPTGVAVNIPSGYYGQIQGRSGLAVGGVDVLGGVIDTGYTGEIVVIAASISNWNAPFKHGDRIAQLIIHKLPEVELVEVDEFTTPSTARGDNGFGSTGR